MKNKISIFFLVLIILVLNSCGDKTEIIKEYYQNGKLKSEYEALEDKKNGFYKEYYENGKIKISAKFSNDLQEGVTYAYYENGEKEREVFFNKGIQQGNCTFYYENGNIREKGQIINGKKNKLFYFYDESGKLRSKLNFIKDEIEGEGLFYNNKGGVEYKILFKKSSPLNLKSIEKGFGFNLNYLDNWHIVMSDIGNGKIGIINSNYKGSFLPSLNVITTNNNDNSSLPEIIDQNIDELKKDYNNLKIIEKGKDYLVYDITHNNIEIRIKCFLAACNNKVFILTCLSAKEDAETYSTLYKIIHATFGCENSNIPKLMID